MDALRDGLRRNTLSVLTVAGVQEIHKLTRKDTSIFPPLHASVDVRIIAGASVELGIVVGPSVVVVASNETFVPIH